MSAASRLPAEDLRGYRAALGAFATGVAVVTARVDEQLLGMTINSFTSVSLDPPLVLWSVGDRASNFDALCSAERFAIHILAADQRGVSDRFAQSSGDKYAGLDWQMDDAQVPCIAACLARFRCRRFEVYPGGDHRIILGEVESFSSTSGDPLMFVQGQYLEFPVERSR
ncbi:MAG: flavin reductase [Halioglobus sp.]|nr:flavin reductase [Halioglobus sp.]